MSASPLTLGCIGYGNMGRALCLGVAGNPELRAAFPLLVYERWTSGRDRAGNDGMPLAQSAAELARRADIVLMAVKPEQMETALAEIAPELGPEKLLLSVAAGVTFARMAELTGGRVPLARVMPNTPALVGEGIFGLCPGDDAPETMRAALRRLFSGLGLLIEIPESKMNAFTALSGSGPAYVFHFLESLAEAGVSVGLDRESSRAVALKLLRGCAKMAEESGLHPAVLREQVSSPAGTTIAGLNHLDRLGARGALVDAVRAADARGRELESGA